MAVTGERTVELTADTLRGMYERMALIRTFEETTMRQFADGQIPGFVHLYAGEEAVAVGVCAHLSDADFITSTHRGHGHCIAKGVDVGGMVAELMGRRTGLCKGKGGSMHVADVEKGMLGANGIVGGGYPLACGAALTAKVHGSGAVAVCFFGDGAANQGTFHESLNLASIWNLPVVFVCENNGYAEATPFSYHCSTADIATRAQGYDIPGVVVDGLDVLAVFEVVGEAIARARRGDGPSADRGQDLPLLRPRGRRHRHLPHRRGGRGVPRPRPADDVRRAPDAQRDRDRGRSGTDDGRRPGHGRRRLYGGRRRTLARPGRDLRRRLRQLRGAMIMATVGTRTLTYSEAVNEALRIAMRQDSNVILLGEDIAGGAGVDHLVNDEAWGGALGVTKGLVQEFGRERVLDTPITESGFIGAAVGAAATGLRPVAELMFVDFFGVCMDQIFDQGAKLRYMFGGKARCPLVIRTTIGAGLNAAAQHSGCHYSVFTHMPGVKTVAPSTPADVKGLLLAAIRDDDLVMFFEHKLLYGMRGEVPEGDEAIPLGVADIKRAGDDVTIVAISRMVHHALEAADQLAAEGIEAEVVDPRTLSPLDSDTILESVAKTHRLVIVDEDNPLCSVATTIAAVVADEGFDSLDAPIKCIHAPHSPVPFSPPLEQEYIPSPERIADDRPGHRLAPDGERRACRSSSRCRSGA